MLLQNKLIKHYVYAVQYSTIQNYVKRVADLGPSLRYAHSVEGKDLFYAMSECCPYKGFFQCAAKCSTFFSSKNVEQIALRIF